MAQSVLCNTCLEDWDWNKIHNLQPIGSFTSHNMPLSHTTVTALEQLTVQHFNCQVSSFNTVMDSMTSVHYSDFNTVTSVQD